MPIFARMDEAVRRAAPTEYIVALEWQGQPLVFATVEEPHRLPVPELVIMQRPREPASAQAKPVCRHCHRAIRKATADEIDGVTAIEPGDDWIHTDGLFGCEALNGREVAQL